jgi:hypothetical protein
MNDHFFLDKLDVDDEEEDEGDVDEVTVEVTGEDVPVDDATAAAIEYCVKAFINQLLLLLLLL